MLHTPLHTVHCRGSLEDVEQMKIRLEVDPILLEALQLETVAIQSQTYALHEASRLNHDNCVRCLLRAGARPDIFDCEIYTAVLHAMSDFPSVTKDESTVVKTVSVLLEGGANPDYVHPLKTCTYYLELAYDKKQYELIKLFLEHGASTEDVSPHENGYLQISNTREPLLFTSIKKKDYKLYSMLLLHGAALNLCDDDGDPILLDHVLFVALIGSRPERFLEMYKLYYEHGGSVWSEVDGSTLLGMFPDDDSDTDSDEISEGSFFFNGESKQVKSLVAKTMSTPRSLLSSCRLAIKKTMGKRYAKDVQELPLPKPVISYLLFTDCERLTTDDDVSMCSDDFNDDDDDDISSGSMDSGELFDMFRNMTGGYDSDDSDGKDVFYYMRLNRHYNPDMYDF